MGFIRRRFYVLEFLAFLGWGLGLGLFGGVLASLLRWRSFAQSIAALGSGAALGPLITAVLWFGWRVLNQPFRRTTFDKMFYGFCSLGVHPLCMLLMDANAKYVVQRFYTGTAPIPFVYLKPAAPAVPSIGAKEK